MLYGICGGPTQALLKGVHWDPVAFTVHCMLVVPGSLQRLVRTCLLFARDLQFKKRGPYTACKFVDRVREGCAKREDKGKP